MGMLGRKWFEKKGFRKFVASRDRFPETERFYFTTFWAFLDRYECWDYEDRSTMMIDPRWRLLWQCHWVIARASLILEKLEDDSWGQDLNRETVASLCEVFRVQADKLRSGWRTVDRIELIDLVDSLRSADRKLDELFYVKWNAGLQSMQESEGQERARNAKKKLAQSLDADFLRTYQDLQSKHPDWNKAKLDAEVGKKFGVSAGMAKKRRLRALSKQKKA